MDVTVQPELSRDSRSSGRRLERRVVKCVVANVCIQRNPIDVLQINVELVLVGND